MPSPRPPHSLKRTITHYASSRVYQQFAGMLTTLLRPKFLGPDLFGVWTLLKVIPKYSFYNHLGTGTSLRYLIPFHMQRGETEHVARLEANAFTVGFVLNVLAGMSLLAASRLGVFSEPVRTGLLAMSGFVVLQFLHEFYLIEMKGHERFDLVTRANYLFVTALLLLSVPLLWFLRLHGLFLSLLLSELVVLGWLRARFGPVTRWGWNGAVLRELLTKGLPVMLLNFGVAVLATVDRFITKGMLGDAALGHYGIAVLAMSALVNVPGAAREVLEPGAMRAAATETETATARRYLTRPLVKTGWLVPFLIGPAYFTLPPFVRTFLPDYVEGIGAAQILVCGAFFITLLYVLRMVIVARNWQAAALTVLPVAIGANLGVNAALVRAGYGIEGVAAGSSASFALAFLLTAGFLWMRLSAARGIVARGAATATASFPFALAFLALGEWAARGLAPESWLHAAAGLAVFLAAQGLLFLLARRRFAALRAEAF